MTSTTQNCAICLDEFHLNDSVTLKPCNHMFCKKCMMKWCDKCKGDYETVTCALCRGDVTSILRTTGETDVAKSVTAFREWLSKASLNEKKHQVDGIRWCLQREINFSLSLTSKCGGLIADEMGLGKTILSLGLIISNFLPRTLIVVPPALISQWCDEMVRLLGHKPLIYWGNGKSKITDKELESAPIVITTYSHISCDKHSDPGQTGLRTLHKFKWDRAIFDEAHHMRNRKLNYLGAMYLKTKITWLLTGTPIHNRLCDLKAYFSLLGISVPGRKEYVSDILKSILLRRTKKDANIVLPTVTHHKIVVEWESNVEKDAAEQIHSMAPLFHVTRSNVNEAFKFIGYHILTTLIRSRQMCILPKMVKNSITDEEDKMEVQYHLSKMSKMNAVVGKLLQRKDNNRKKLVFCHFRQEIDEIYTSMIKEDISCEFFDGRVSTTQRLLILSESPDVLILQMKTACEGLNLQQYQEVYFVSPNWNPAVEDQAIGRCHRIGQENEIDVFHFTMENFSPYSFTLDNFCMDVQKYKREISEIIDASQILPVFG